MKNKTETTPAEPTTPSTTPRRLNRIPSEGKIAGVCAGLAAYLDIDVTIVRVIFVVLTLASGGFGVLVYLILAIVMPTADVEGGSAGKNLEENITGLGNEFKEGDGVDRLRTFFGYLLVLFGAWLLLVQLFPRWFDIDWSLIWPLALVLLGILVLVRSRR